MRRQWPSSSPGDVGSYPGLKEGHVRPRFRGIGPEPTVRNCDHLGPSFSRDRDKCIKKGDSFIKNKIYLLWVEMTDEVVLKVSMPQLLKI